MLRGVALAVVLGAAGPATVTDLGTLPGGSTSTVFGMSGDVAVGTSSTTDAFQHAFVHDANGMRDLGGLGDLTNSAAADVNSAGHVVGLVTSENAVESRPVRWIDGRVEDLGALDGGTGGALAINNEDVVVGWSTIADGTTHGFRWHDGTLEDLDAVLPKPAGSTVESGEDIDDAGRIVGRVALADGQRVGYLWDGTTVRQIQFEPGTAADATDLGPSGEVVGTSWATNGSRPFVWRDGTGTELSPPAGDGCAAANAVAGNGDIVGWSSLCGRSPSRAVIWRDGVPADVQAFLTPGDELIMRGFWAADERGRAGGYAEKPEVGSHAVVFDPGSIGPARVAGANAIETSMAEFQRLAPGPRFGVVVAPVDAPADLALASFFAARRGYPLLLTHRDALDAPVAETLRNSPMFGSTVYLVGGTAVLSPAVEQGITSTGFRPERIAGSDRYGTSAAVGAAVGGSASVFAVDGFDTTTAISAVPLAAHRHAIIVLTGPGHSAPAGARVITAADRETLAAELAPRPIAPTVARFTRISDGAVGAVLAARAGSPLRWVEHAGPGDVFLVGGTDVLPERSR